MVYAGQVLNVNSKRALCTTADGGVAMTLGKTRPGDQIALLACATTPFVLRPIGDHHILIGACYVHGVMYGEAFPTGKSELDWFTLR
jgi:hypothetical protein